jgi:hypothetical protein
MKTIVAVFHVALTVLCLGFLRESQAVVPPPDGGYPNFTTAEGTNALQNLTTGAGNTGVGWYALFSAAGASNNTGIGAGALALNTAENNTAVGTAAMFLNTAGAQNTALGTATLVFNNGGEGNTATGTFALYSNTEGDFNTANGEYSLYFNNTGERNTAIGDSALYGNTSGDRNTAIGNAALVFNTSSSNNTAVGAGALHVNTGGNNTATGADALSDNTTGHHNTAAGDSALSSNTTGTINTAFGFSALGDSVSGMGNTAIGWVAGAENTSGNFNTYLGVGGHVVDGEDDTIRIGDPGFGVACFIGGIWTESGGSQAVYVNSNGKLGAQVSSRRFKDEIKPMEQASEVIYGLEPVSFRYKPEINPGCPPSYGLIAEDVEAIHPDLVLRDKEGKPYSVRYDQVNAMLLNEFLKEHRKIQKLESTVRELKSGMTALAATVKEQTAQIQKISVNIESSKPTLELLADRR